MQEVLDSVLRKIKPTQKEEEQVKKFVDELLRVAKTVTGLDCVVVGSIGKFTWITGDHDIDVFVMFPRDASRESLEKNGLDFGEKIVRHMKGMPKVKYAEHPYTSATIKGYKVDIVPCYRMEKGGHVQSAVDRSPLHLHYVLSHLSPRMHDQVRLLKQFCKGSGVYGSDAKHMGFSGYICELLIMYYQNFENAVKAAASWAAPQIVDVIGFTDKTKFPNQPLIIVDPVDLGRNAAAVVSTESFLKFVIACKQFVTEPRASFFVSSEPKPLTPKQTKYLANRGTRFFCLSFRTPDIIDDVLYPQVRKASKRITNLMRHNEFSVLRSNDFVSGNTVYFIFELEIFSLPPINNQEGPPVFSKHHTAEFLSKYRGKNFVYVEGNNLVTEVKRSFHNPASMLSAFLKRDRDTLIADGTPNQLAENIAKAQILEQEAFFRVLRKDKELSDFIREKYFVDLGKQL